MPVAKKNKLGWFWKLVLFLNIISGLLLLLAYMSAYIEPKSFPLLSFLGILYPLFLVGNLFFVLLWLLKKYKYSLISLVCIIIGINHVFENFQFSSVTDLKGKKDMIKVMSYNVKNFDLYNYKPHWQYNFEKRNLIFDYIKKESPDIICFQEFMNDKLGEFKTLDTLVKFQKASNVYAEYTFVSKGVNEFGIATFSSYPIVDKGRINFPNSKNNIGIYTDLQIGKDIVRVYNVHFESLHFSADDYRTAESIDKIKDLDKNKNKYLRILRIMKRAYINRADQVDIIAESIRNCKYPVILCTDLNDTPVSYAYHNISDGLKDAFVDSGKGYGRTLVSIFTLFRIDYIFFSNHFNSYNFTTGDVKYSDHFPVSCYLERKK